jgi:hypothetical protein
VRVLRVHVARRGFRTRVLDLVTTLMDAQIYTKKLGWQKWLESLRGT